jgi:hypothetical protein
MWPTDAPVNTTAVPCASLSRQAWLVVHLWRTDRIAFEPNYPGPDVVTTKTPAPPVVVECWCLMVATMNRVRLDTFTRETWRTFDPTDLEPLEWAMLRRRRDHDFSNRWPDMKLARRSAAPFRFVCSMACVEFARTKFSACESHICTVSKHSRK